MTQTEKEQLRSELLAYIDEKLSKVETKQPRRMTLFEWMKLCSKDGSVIKIVRGVCGFYLVVRHYGVSISESVNGGTINIKDLTEQWEEVL